MAVTPLPENVQNCVDDVARQGATPLVVADNKKILGVIQLKDIVKGGIKERFGELRKMGIRTIMITGDNPLTAAAIAASPSLTSIRNSSISAPRRTFAVRWRQTGHLSWLTSIGARSNASWEFCAKA